LAIEFKPEDVININRHKYSHKYILIFYGRKKIDK